MWIPEYLNYNSKKLFPLIISINGDYATAIKISNALTNNNKNYISEGGVTNIARRDGMGTVILDATRHIGKLPDYYFQAVGSGTGGIAAYEASLRIINDGNYGTNVPRLYLIQNTPCAPLFQLYSNNKLDSKCPDGIVDDVLFNRTPPYEINGGVKDILKLSNGILLGVTKEEVEFAKKIFEKEEQIDIASASDVAVAGLIKSIQQKLVDTKKIILLNITSGGILRYKKKYKINYIKPKLIINSDYKIDDIIKLINDYIYSKIT